MHVIAIAGGTGHVGRTLYEELRKWPADFDVLVLGRSPSPNIDPAHFAVVDYDDVPAVAALLRDRHVTTVVSTIMVMDQAASEAQVRLVEAVGASGTVRRFVASEWGVSHIEPSPITPLRDAVVSALRNTSSSSSLEWTRVTCGYFLDYYGLPHVPSYLVPMAFAVDVAAKTAAIPGTGDEILALTYTQDLARFMVELLRQPETERWDETTYIYSDKTTFNKLLKLAEDARNSKFTVTYDSLDKLAQSQVTELPSHIPMYPFVPKPMVQSLLALFGTWVIQGRFDVPHDKSLNAKFPDIQTHSVADIVGAWKGK